MNQQSNNKIVKLYYVLYKKYGPQGWWPLLELHKNNINPTKTGSLNGYHPKDYTYPKNNLQKWEIIVGSLLTQNTSWPQVEKALVNLHKTNLLNPNTLIKSNLEKIKQCIKPSGYYNQKSERLLLLARWFLAQKNVPSRKELLSLKGIGPESADSILLYAYKQPSFIIDTYTKRIFKQNKIITENLNYNELKELIEKSIPKKYEIYQEFHALLVEHAKNSLSKIKDKISKNLSEKINL